MSFTPVIYVDDETVIHAQNLNEIQDEVLANSSAKHTHSNKSILDTITQALIDTWNTVTGKYEKPSTGIPKTDLASDVQTSLGLADTALQTHQDISGKVDKTTTVNGHALSADVAIADTDIAHGSSTVGATLTSQSSQIATLQSRTNIHLGTDSNGRFCIITE